MEKINEDIKENKLEHVYLLYGDEQFVVKTYRNRLLKALLGTDSMEELKADLNFSAFVGTAFDVDNAIQMASSFPFMAEKRVVLMENTKVFSRENKALEKCIRNLPLPPMSDEKISPSTWRKIIIAVISVLKAVLRRLPQNSAKK